MKIRLFRRPDEKEKTDRIERAYRAMLAEREMTKQKECWLCMQTRTPDL